MSALITAEIRRFLSRVYYPEGVDIWMTNPHQWFDGKTANQMIEEGKGEEVLQAAINLAYGNFG